MNKILFSLLLTSVIAACNNDSSNTIGVKDSATEVTEGVNNTGGTVHANAKDTIVTDARPVNLNGCYQMTMKRDTADLHITVKDSIVTGTLAYKFFEKDKNTGTIKGVLRDNKIYADYTFLSEGVTSVREVIFKISNSSLLQASGELKEENGKVVFTNVNDLDYNNLYPFIKVDCP